MFCIEDDCCESGVLADFEGPRLTHLLRRVAQPRPGNIHGIVLDTAQMAGIVISTGYEASGRCLGALYGRLFAVRGCLTVDVLSQRT